MRKIILVSVACGFFLSLAVARAYIFNQDLKYGDNKADIAELQAVLEVNPNGQNTTFFGNLTKKAVVTFQNKVGLPTTGYVGPLTRQKLNDTASVAQSNTQNISSNQTFVVLPSEKIDIYATDRKYKL